MKKKKPLESKINLMPENENELDAMLIASYKHGLAQKLDGIIKAGILGLLWYRNQNGELGKIIEQPRLEKRNMMPHPHGINCCTNCGDSNCNYLGDEYEPGEAYTCWKSGE